MKLSVKKINTHVRVFLFSIFLSMSLSVAFVNPPITFAKPKEKDTDKVEKKDKGKSKEESQRTSKETDQPKKLKVQEKSVIKHNPPVQIKNLLVSRSLEYPNGRLRMAQLAQDESFYRHKLPKGTFIFWNEDGTPRHCFLSRNATIQGYPLRGGGHDWMTVFHPNGSLKVGWLAKDTEIQGVPCAKATFWRDVAQRGAQIEFYPNGSLKRCKLSKEFTYQGKTYRKGYNLTISDGGSGLDTKRMK